jgi:sugar phosphate isomerase/epimerase
MMAVMSTSRRGFLGTAVGVSLTPAFAEPLDPAEHTDGFKLGVASYSFREFSRRIAIEMTRRLNISYINIKDVHLGLKTSAKDIEKARKEFADAGLTILGGGNISFDKDDEADIRSKFEYAKACGMPLMVCAPTPVTLPKMEKYVKEFNIKIAVHNHGPEDKNFPTPQSVLAIVKNMDSRCGLCIDIGHTARTGVDVVGSIREAGSRLLDMHVKDLTDFSKKEAKVPVGDGIMPFPAIFRELKKMSYGGGVMLEYEIDEDDPVPAMDRSFGYMRGVLAGMRT